ncbi:MAG: secretion system protein [Chloroflexi bacterium]|nr:MAG: secretion system protein [Phototrophicales bacterium]RMF82303.1 MAG: secretion system protein [Chloroflexota bacterium]
MTPEQIAIIGAAAGVAFIILVIGVINVRSERASDLVDERLGRLDEGFTSFLDEEEDSDSGGGVSTAIEQRLEQAIEQRSFGKKWRGQLAKADIKLNVAEYFALHIISMIGFFTVAYFVVFRFNIVLSILAAFVGLFAPRIYVSRATSRRLNRFEAQLPDTLGLWVNALRSGFSVLQAMEAISKDAPEPTATEFRRVVQEVALGINVEDALDHLLARVESEDLDLVITAVNIQREVGGNLAEILDVISNTIRERIKLKGEIRVLTSQGRITGYLIGGLPIFLSIFLYTIQPDYMGSLFENKTCGWPMVGIGLGLIGIGQAIIQKIVDIDI